MHDFDLLHDHADPTALFGEIWSEIRVRPYEMLQDGIVGSKYRLNDKHFLDFLYLLKILPSARYKFETSVNNFIKIIQVIFNVNFCESIQLIACLIYLEDFAFQTNSFLFQSFEVQIHFIQQILTVS